MEIKNLLTYLLPILTALLLLLFFVGLPNLKTCELPRIDRRRLKRPAREDRSRRLTRRDLLPILLITLLYAVTAFFRLGVNTAPQTFVSMGDRTAELVLPEGAVPSRTLVYAGPGYGGYDVAWSEDGEHYANVSSFTHDHIAVLKWTELETRTGLEQPRYVRFTCTYGQPWLGEVVLLDADGQTSTAFSSTKRIISANPRTAIGYYEPGHYCLVVVDGRGESAGISLPRLSQLFYDLGCTAAYNLDGGNSSIMVWGDEVINNPSGGGRESSDALLIAEVRNYE